MKFPGAVAMVLLITFQHGSGKDVRVIDSLVTELSGRQSDTSRCRLMLEIAAQYIPADTVTAMEFLDKSLQIADSLDDRNYLGLNYQIRGEMHTSRGRYEEALIEFDKAMTYYYESDNDVGYYEVMKNKGNVHLYISEYSQAMNYYETALDFYMRKGLADGASNCLNNMGIIYKNRGEYVEALSAYEESIKLIDEGKAPMQVARGYINMGNVFVYLGRYERALEYYQSALELVEKGGNPDELALVLQNTGVVQNKCGNFREAEERYRRALAIGRQLGNPVLISNCLINIGTNYSEMGRLEEAREYVEKGLAMKMELGDDRTISNCHIYLAEVYYKMDDLQKADVLFRKAIPTKELIGDKEGLTMAYLGLAKVYFNEENYNEANLNADTALHLAQEIGALEHISEGYRIKQMIAASTGDFSSAYLFATDQSRVEDSLMDRSTANAAMEMEFRYRSKALEKENENLRIQSTLYAEVMRKRKAFLYALAGIAILLTAGLVLGVYLIRRLRQSSMKLEEKNLVITRQNMKLDTLNRTKDRMMSIIAHDLRGTIGNQLIAIEVMHSMEKNGETGMDRNKLLGNLKHSASYSLELLENLLLWSRLEENKSFFHPEKLDLARIIRNCTSLFDETANSKDLAIHQDIREGIRMNGDKIMIETIVRNLISNSIKFSMPGGEISVKATESGGSVLIEVADKGVGMNDEQLNQMMNNSGFTRRGTSNEKGAGIGMTLVREFAEIHHAKLTVDSREGEGTRISLAFPKQA